jgi:predicted O-methyltransferase YrrM
MSQAIWTAVDEHFASLFHPEDEVLRSAQHAAKQAGLPPISVAPFQGRLLYLLTRLMHAKRILEIGTLAGYSAIHFARALPADGHLDTLELDPRHAAVALANLERAGLAPLVTIHPGPAADTLQRFRDRRVAPYDLVFIDADKESSDTYFDHALALSRPGTLIIIDNTVRRGAIVDAAATDPSTQGIHRVHRRIASEPRVSPFPIQLVSSKGYDGMTMALVH